MEYEIKNNFLTVRISTKGGELRSIRDAEGREYLWQGDEATWQDRGPNLFPYMGRMTDKTYTCEGKEYHMEIHGFLIYSEMELVSRAEDTLVMKLEASDFTREQYPFEFRVEIRWRLVENSLEMTWTVDNLDSRTMYFGVGGHPGFRMPVDEGLDLEDYRLDFGSSKEIRREKLSGGGHMLDEDEPFPLEEGRYLPLHNGLFAEDSLILRETTGSAVLESPEGRRKIRVDYPDMDYLVLWKWEEEKTDFLCIEPWTSLPSREGIVEALETQKNLISLNAGGKYTNTWSITIF